jgi:ATP-dependent helicase/nuclease subunit A
VVQGAADLAVILPEEIWLVDFKTDRMSAADVATKVKLYEPQLRIYAMALSRIYRRPVTRAHLHFLSLRRSEKVSLASVSV